jgi:regulator of protease activity HflC (stomatin/prohibitin superfamily)
MIVLNFALYVVAIWLFVRGIDGDAIPTVLLGVFLFLLSILTSAGFFIVNPNYAAILVLFGTYKGTVTSNGFFWTNPFMQKIKISLRVRNMEGARLKVNDRVGNPIEIAAVVVWKVIDAYRAQFDVDNYLEFVKIQSETALRHMASQYAYDGEDTDLTLRGSTDVVSERLKVELHERLERAGVEVIEARLSHLAYAAEIAGEMLRRQQATAVVAARFKIVEGAVGMVEHALDELSKRKFVSLDEERKAAMVSNLLVVLCSDHAATPVVNAGTLYQ